MEVKSKELDLLQGKDGGKMEIQDLELINQNQHQFIKQSGPLYHMGLKNNNDGKPWVPGPGSYQPNYRVQTPTTTYKYYSLDIR